MAKKTVCYGTAQDPHPGQMMFCPDCVAPGDAISGSVVGGKVLSLSDVKRDKNLRMILPYEPGQKFVASECEYTAVTMEVVREYEAQQLALGEVAGHVITGKISPAAREKWERVALSDLPTFREIMADMKPMVDLKEHGHGFGGGGVDAGSVEHEVISLSEARATADGVSFSEGMKRVGQDRPDLYARYQSVTRSTMRHDD